jgi:protein SCO1/2
MQYTGPKIGGDFILLDQDNKQFDSKQLRGQYMLIYFGFTFCPDICPASLAEIGQITSILKANNKHIKYLFISIDPERDTPEQLKNYFANFPHIISLTGSKKQIQEVADKFKVYYSVASDGKQNTDHYMVNHSSFFYLVDDKGDMVKIYPSGSRGLDIGYDILQRIKLNRDIHSTNNN